MDDVSFDVGQHEVLGLLGPNGSGKTTVLRVLTGYLRPSAGAVQAGGFDLVRQGPAARGRIGYVPEDAPLYPHMRVNEFLAFMGGLRGLQGETLHRRMDARVRAPGAGRCALDHHRPAFARLPPARGDRPGHPARTRTSGAR